MLDNKYKEYTVGELIQDLLKLPSDTKLIYKFTDDSNGIYTSHSIKLTENSIIGYAEEYEDDS